MRTGNVLREQLCSNRFSFAATVGVGVPDSSHDEVSVVAGVNFEVLCESLSQYRSIVDDVQAEVGDGRRIVCRVCEVDVHLHSHGGRGGIDDTKVSSFELELSSRRLIVTIAIAMTNRWIRQVSEA